MFALLCDVRRAGYDAAIDFEALTLLGATFIRMDPIPIRIGLKSLIDDRCARRKFEIYWEEAVSKRRTPENANGIMIVNGSNTGTREIRIGVDGRFFEAQRTGIGNYIFELCRALDASIPHGQFYVYSQSPVEMPVCSNRWLARHETVTSWRRVKSTLWMKHRVPNLCRKDCIEVFWGAGPLIPPPSAALRRVATVHDLMHQIAPETMSIGARWSFRMFFRRDLAGADAIVTNSRGTAEKLERLLGLKGAVVVRPGLSDDFRPASPARVAQCLDCFGICGPYLLWVGDPLSPRKNVLSLVRAFLEVRKTEAAPALNLVLAGPRRDNNTELARIVEANRQCIVTTGYVSGTDLRALYSGARAFVFPSVYEGYGMPVLEARACGTRVVTSDLPELREAGGDDAVYVKPTVDGIRAGIAKALAMPPAPALDAARPTWTHSARLLAQTLMGDFGICC